MTLGYNIFKSDLDKVNFKKNKIINTINPHSYCVSKKDKIFEKALKESDILLPDGIGIVFAEFFLNRVKVKKIAGYDLFIFLINQLSKKKGSVFFLGSSNRTLEKIRIKLLREYPKIKFSSYSPPFKDEFSEIDSRKICKKINDFKPDVLFVGMTAPKQEKWVFKYKDKLDVCNICSIGAVFDFYAENINRPSKFWVNLGLEWFPRFIKEPIRLYKRNFYSTPKFIFEVVSIKLFGKGIL